MDEPHRLDVAGASALVDDAMELGQGADRPVAKVSAATCGIDTQGQSAKPWTCVCLAAPRDPSLDGAPGDADLPTRVGNGYARDDGLSDLADLMLKSFGVLSHCHTQIWLFFAARGDPVSGEPVADKTPLPPTPAPPRNTGAEGRLALAPPTAHSADGTGAVPSGETTASARKLWRSPTTTPSAAGEQAHPVLPLKSGLRGEGKELLRREACAEERVTPSLSRRGKLFR